MALKLFWQQKQNKKLSILCIILPEPPFNVHVKAEPINDMTVLQGDEDLVVSRHHLIFLVIIIIEEVLLEVIIVVVVTVINE